MAVRTGMSQLSCTSTGVVSVFVDGCLIIDCSSASLVFIVCMLPYGVCSNPDVLVITIQFVANRL